MQELRKHERYLTLKTGKICGDLFTPDIACAIFNLGEGGACLLVEDPFRIPEAFNLAVDPHGTVFRCKLAWTSRHRVGVSFLPAHGRQEQLCEMESLGATVR